MDDHELLRDYVEKRSENAFRELVERHLPMVFSAARRMARDANLAEEIAQDVFNTLAQKGETIRPPQVIGGWLYNTTRHLAMHAVRGEQRRRERELTAIAMQTDETNFDTEQIHESLEPAMAELNESERDALVLRFLENRSLSDVGAELGISEDAARMRVNRALEQLRGAFGRQDIGVTSVLLATTLASSTSSVVPTSLAIAISTTALATGATVSTTITQTTITTMNWLNVKTAAAIAGAALIAGSGTYLAQQTETKRLRAENQTLVAQQATFVAERDKTIRASQPSNEELERLRKDTSELLRLRNEVGQLRRQNEVAKLAHQPTLQKPGVAKPAKNPGAYVSKDELAFVGYATPEDGLKSMNWAMMTGNYEAARAALNLEGQAQEFEELKGKDQFEKGYKKMAALFKGMQVVAKKILAEDKVELKVKLDMEPIPDNSHELPPFMIQPMVKVGNEWKLGGSTRGYESKWDSNGQIEMLAP